MILYTECRIHGTRVMWMQHSKSWGQFRTTENVHLWRRLRDRFNYRGNLQWYCISIGWGKWRFCKRL